jgi:hypothetical protein
MENIHFFLHENEIKNENKIISPEDLIKLNSEIIESASYEEEEHSYDIYDIYDIEQLELCYKTNYNVKALTQLLQYYGIYKSKMVKDEMIQVLLFFETDPQNKDILHKRLRLWQNLKELKTDAFLGKYILFDIY